MSDGEGPKQRHEVKVGGYDWPDYIVHAWLINSCVVGVHAVEVIGTDQDDKLIMLRRGWVSSPDDSVTDPFEAEVIVEGSIKWDGCSDLTIGRAGYVHSCGRQDAGKLGKLIDRLYDIARDTMVEAGTYVQIDDGY